ncbi:hydroxyethylthiazole kinase [Paraliobacillus sp. X-1268]|uniref:hydroxyethylthiazole kinase n=1 Tax=Paraliobacillus sp. X-1268 TaxID=2213193 RepID=UPI001300BA56|nr:hydroxyethylthiazole kinase [Paraliobacillus sp. X-1268]
MNKITRMIELVREKEPLVHNITNEVVVNFTANGLYAIGASPVMASAIEEVGEMAKNADGLLLNIGTLTSNQAEAMIVAGKAANEKGIPVVLDPVAVGATSLRSEVASRILEEVKISLIRGNAGEISNLSGAKAEVRGVDSVGTLDNRSVAIHAAKQLGVPVMVTGVKDVITDGKELYTISNGTQLLTKVTGTGCLLGAVIAAFLTTGEKPLLAATAAVAFYDVAAERARQNASAPGSFQIAFLDALFETNAQHVSEKINITHESLDED